MRTDEWVDRLIAAVRRRIGGKELSEAETLAQVAPGYLRKAQGTTRNVMISKFLRICEHGGIDPAEIFAEAFPVEQPTLDYGIPIPKRPVPHIVRRVRELGAQTQEQHTSPFPRQLLEWFDELRYDKPERALKLTEAIVEHVSPTDYPLALGVWASTCRLCSRYDEAFLACVEGLEIAGRHEDRLGEVDLLQRLSFLIVSMSADYDAALRISERAGTLCLRTGDLNRVGRVLVDQGSILYYLQRYRESEETFESAIAILDEDERRHRLTALHTLGLLCQARGFPERALEYCHQVAPMVASRFERGKLNWLEAVILADLQSLESALEKFQQAWDALAETSVIDAALSACDHVEILLRSGSFESARVQSRYLQALLEPLRENPIASAAIRDFVRCEQEGNLLNAAFLAGIRKRLEDSRRIETRRL